MVTAGIKKVNTHGANKKKEDKNSHYKVTYR